MKVLKKYIGLQIFYTAIFGIGLFVWVLMVGSAFKDILQQLASHKLTLATFLQLIVLVIPKVVPYAFPLGFLMAVLLVIGRLSAEGELTAMRASGISMGAVMQPVFVLAAGAAAVCLAIDAYCAPLASGAYRATLYNSVRTHPGRFFTPRTFIKDFPGYVLYIEDINEARLNNIWVWELNPDKQPVIFLKASQGTLEHKPETDALILTLLAGVAETRASTLSLEKDPLPALSFERLTLRLPLNKIFRAQGASRKLSHHTLTELLEDRYTWRSSPDPSLAAAFKDRIQVQLEIHKKLAMAASIFCLALIGIPLAVQKPRQDTTYNFILTLGLGLGYYLAITLISGLVNSPHFRPDFLIWAPNLFLLALGSKLYANLDHV